MYPIHFKPVYQTYIWGGERIGQFPHRKTDLPKIAESWEIADRPEGMSVVDNGIWKGKTLHELVLELGVDLMGEGQTFEHFPILAKIIDAKENLSIQVHPDETSARLLKAEPKAEMWVMLDDGAVYAGFQKTMNREHVLQAIEENRLEECLEKWELKKGEAANIPGGRVHAICAGSFLYEIQQNSNTTYRLYDWGRNRQLHLKEGLESIRFDDKGEAKVIPRHLSSDLHHQLVILVSTPLFMVERIDVFDLHHLAPIPRSFQIFYCLQGKAKIEVDGNEEIFEPGMTYLVPAACHSINLVGHCQALRIRLTLS